MSKKTPDMSRYFAGCDPISKKTNIMITKKLDILYAKRKPCKLLRLLGAREITRLYTDKKCKKPFIVEKLFDTKHLINHQVISLGSSDNQFELIFPKKGGHHD